MPEGAIYVGRGKGQRWGNPYLPVDGDVQSAVNAFEKELLWYLSGVGCDPTHTAKVREGLELLRGHDLVCWCAEGRVCHGDVLLRLADK